MGRQVLTPTVSSDQLTFMNIDIHVYMQSFILQEYTDNIIIYKDQDALPTLIKIKILQVKTK